jgi:GntR family transcriptional repressor for pyruvate dehydrogenase complex
MAEILAMIKSGEIQPGDKLPPERELATAMQVSRPSLREALRTLAFMGIVEIIHGQGVYVTTLQPDLLVEHLDFIFALEDYTFLQLLEARKIIEPGFAELAARRIKNSEIIELKDLLEESVESVEDPEYFMQVDIDLHKKIAEIAHNPILDHLMASVDRLGRASRSRTNRLPGVLQHSVQDHRAIVDAIVTHQPAAAREAMIQHLENIEAELKRAAGTALDLENDGHRTEPGPYSEEILALDL